MTNTDKVEGKNDLLLMQDPDTLTWWFEHKTHILTADYLEDAWTREERQHFSRDEILIPLFFFSFLWLFVLVMEYYSTRVYLMCLR